MKILIVEDEEFLQHALRKRLKKLGYTAQCAFDGNQALDFFYENQYDLIICDLGIPKIDGIELIKRIREVDEFIKILILSSRNEITDKVLGLNIGANDYLTKPFDILELEARINALLRRQFYTNNNVLKIQNVEINTDKKIVKVNGMEINLTNKEYAILEYLFLNKSKIISAEELLEHVWDSNEDFFSNAITVHISTLRKKIKENIIHTKKGMGYYVE